MRRAAPGHDPDSRVGQSTPHGTEDLRADAVQPVDVVDDQQYRLGEGRRLQQVQQRRHQGQYRHHGIRIAAEDRCQHCAVLLIQAGLVRLEPVHHLIQPAQREGLLGLHAQDPHHLPAFGRRERAHLIDQRRLADAGLPGHHNGPLGVLGQHPAQLGKLGLSANQIAHPGHVLIIEVSSRIRVISPIPVWVQELKLRGRVRCGNAGLISRDRFDDRRRDAQNVW